MQFAAFGGCVNLLTGEGVTLTIGCSAGGIGAGVGFGTGARVGTIFLVGARVNLD